MSGQQINTSTHTRTYLVQRAAVEHLPKAPFLLRSAPHHLPEPTISAKMSGSSSAPHCSDADALDSRAMAWIWASEVGAERGEKNTREQRMRAMAWIRTPHYYRREGCTCNFLRLRRMPCPRQSQLGNPRSRSEQVNGVLDLQCLT